MQSKTQKRRKPAAVLAVLMWISFFTVAATAGDDTSAVEAEPVVVTATKTEHSLADAPVKTTVITRKEIEEKQLTTLQDAFRSIPGLRVMRAAGTWGDSGKIMLRGLDAKHTLILVDGHRVYGGHSDSVDLQAYPLAMVERIEVVQGPGSALYGSEAMGGVINIITRKPAAETRLNASAAFGSRDTQQYEGALNVGKEKVGATLGYSFRHTDGIAPDTDETTEQAVHGAINVKPGDRSDLDLSVLFARQEMVYEAREQDRFGINPSWQWRPDAISSVKVWGSWFRYEHATGDLSTDYIQDVYEAEIDYTRLFFERHNITLGLQHETEKRDDTGKGFEAQEEVNSLFVSDEIDFHPLVLVLGLRMDQHEEWNEQYNPKASLMYQVNDRIRLRGAVGTSFSAPSLSKLYGSWMMGPYRVQPNVDLEPEESLGYEAGADVQLTQDASLSLTAFRNDVENLIVSRIVRSGARPYNLFWENVDEAVTQGVETTFRADWCRHFSSVLGYTFLDTENKSTGKELVERPNHKIDLDLTARWADLGLTLTLTGQYIGERYADEDNDEALAEYTVWDLSVTKTIQNHWQVFLRLDNITAETDIVDEDYLDGTVVMGGVKLTY